MLSAPACQAPWLLLVNSVADVVGGRQEEACRQWQKADICARIESNTTAGVGAAGARILPIKNGHMERYARLQGAFGRLFTMQRPYSPSFRYDHARANIRGHRAILNRTMCALGHKQTFRSAMTMSALGQKRTRA